MSATPVYGYRYPTLSLAPDVCADIKNLADDVEAKTVLIDAAQALQNGGEFRASALQNMATGATKLNFGTTVRAATGITWNGSNQFTVTKAGLYAMSAFAKVTFGAANSYAISIAGATYPTGVGSYTGEDFSYNTTDVACGNTRWLDVGAVICCYIYNNGSAQDTNYAIRPAEFNVWRVG